ncbi:MAG: hypothetical protein KBC48_00165 [Candidatus Pacebacteria bacterium]|nr:hypothetical protein [Candidatus Paceibacterota bacterium]
MKQKIKLEAELVTTTCMRLFLADANSEYRNRPFYEDSYWTVSLPGNSLPTHEEALAFIRKKGVRKKEPGKLGKYGPIIRFNKWGNDVVFAYQLVEVTKIVDNRKKWGHENQSTTKTSKVLSKKVFIFGKMVGKKKVSSLLKFVDSQMKALSDEREDHDRFDKLGVSVYTPMEGKKFLRQRKLKQAIKMGPANFVPYSPKMMEFRPLR